MILENFCFMERRSKSGAKNKVAWGEGSSKRVCEIQLNLHLVYITQMSALCLGAQRPGFGYINIT